MRAGVLVVLLIGIVSLILILSIIFGISFNQSKTDGSLSQKEQANQYGSISQKEQAKQFSLTVVKTYFNKDCDSFYNYLDNQIRLLDDGTVVSKEGMKEKLCESISKAITGEHSFEEYVSSYDIVLLNKSESDLKFPGRTSLLTEGEYLFAGYDLRQDKQNFIWDDLFMFAVKKVGSRWKITALSG